LSIDNILYKGYSFLCILQIKVDGQKRGYSTEHNVDYGYGIIDTVWKISIHPSLPEIKCGFIETDDWQDNQYSIGILEEAISRGIRSGMERIYLVTGSEGCLQREEKRG
jgi:hypothetical protein